MQEIRIKVEDGIPYNIALDFCARCIDDIDPTDKVGWFTFKQPDENLMVMFRINKTITFEVCKTQSKKTE